MNNLVIDIGNSLVKIAVFTDRNLIYKETFLQPDLFKIRQIIQKHQVNNSILCSVIPDFAEVENLLKTLTRYIRFSIQTDLPIQNQYQTKDTLGSDRLAALMGARQINPEQNTLVIDAGTCITYDLIDHQNRYFGGSISPGINMRFKALHTFTGKLPHVTFDAKFTDLIGKDTQGSILSGVINGVLAEVRGIIEKYCQQYPEMSIVLCGGDADFFENHLKNSIFAHNFSLQPDLVLIGLNEVIHHQHD